MNTIGDTFYDIKRKMLLKYPRFGTEVANSNIEFKNDLKYHTASTDGENIYVDPNYYASLNENDKLFIIAHEMMHIKFLHMYRLMDKNGQKRDRKLWNRVTDAIINANLERDGFTIKKGYVNMPEALNYSAEEFYEILKEKNKKENQQSKGQNQEQNQNNQSNEQNREQEQNQEQNQNNQSNEQNQEQEQEDQSSEQQQKTDKEEYYGDDHSLWEEAFKKHEQEAKEMKSSSKQSKKQDINKNNVEEETEEICDEREEFENNREEKREKFKNRCKKVTENLNENNDKTIKLDNIGESNQEINWKTMLRREIEKEETSWSNRRSIAENNYAYRLEDNDIEDEAETEVMIDVSGSVSLDLVKGFLRQLKPLLKQSKLRVACFNEKFWGFVNIKNVKDIDNFTIPEQARGESAWTEDWDLAVRSFTKKKEINKIVFTDGYPCPGTMPKEDLKMENIIWLVYGNKDFKPCCGKVINISKKQLEKLKQIDEKVYLKDRTR